MNSTSRNSEDEENLEKIRKSHDHPSAKNHLSKSLNPNKQLNKSHMSIASQKLKFEIKLKFLLQYIVYIYIN